MYNNQLLIIRFQHFIIAHKLLTQNIIRIKVYIKSLI
jgi:hypothetical protein